MTPQILGASSPSSGSSWPVSDERVLIQRELVSISYAGCKCFVKKSAARFFAVLFVVFCG